MIKHIIFDFDGTIVNSRSLAVRLFNEMANKHKFQMIKEKDISFLSSLSILERCRVLHIPYYKIPLLVVEITKNYRKTIDSLKTFNGIKDVIDKLKEKGFKLSIISSNSTKNISRFIKNNNIDVFDSVFSVSNIFGKDKTIRSFLHKNKLNKKEAIYIGDEYRDVIACQKNDVKIIAVTWGYDSIELLTSANPDFIVVQPIEIFNLDILNMTQ